MPSKNLSNVNVGAVANSGTGDLLRDAFIKINDNFNSIYTSGQFLARAPDTKLTPGYTWEGDKDTGMYRVGSGIIGFTLNGSDSLIMNEDRTLTWFNKNLATQDYVLAQLTSFTGGISGANITVNAGNGAGNVSVTVNGVPVVSSLPTVGNYQGRIVFYLGDIWTYSSYPVGNGTGLAADSAIARAAGSDSRWVRFRGDQAITVGLVRPAIAAEGTTFYETGNAVLYVYLSGNWKTLSSLITSNAPSGLDVLTVLPATGDPNNYSGRTVVVGSTAYIFISGAWKSLSDYVGGAAGSGAGISFGTTLPATATANVGDLFRKTGLNDGLYIFSGTNWNTIQQYTANSTTARIKTLAALPTDTSFYNPGELIIVGGSTYILNTGKTAWDLFTPGANTTVQNIVLNAGQVGNVELAVGSVINTKILANTITGDKFVSNTVGTRELNDSSVTSSKLASNAITSAKIQSGAITSREISANSITGDRIVSGTITSLQLAPGSIAVSKVSANTLSELSTNAGTITAGVLKSADNKMVIDLNSKTIRIEL